MKDPSQQSPRIIKRTNFIVVGMARRGALISVPIRAVGAVDV